MSKISTDDLLVATLAPNIFDRYWGHRRIDITTSPTPISWGAACHFVEEQKRPVFFIDGESVKAVATVDELIDLHGNVNEFFTQRPIIKIPIETKIYRAIQPYLDEGGDAHNAGILRKIKEVLIENGVRVE